MPTMSTTVIDEKGHWLRTDAALSWLRMVADAGTADGLVVAGRTYAEQARLYSLYRAGRGNLAAKPGSSLHESGLAVDVTRKSPLQLWMTHGGDPMRVTKTGSIRANEYGWSRTVPPEAWHFRYYPERDKHRAAVTPPPVVVPPPIVTPKPTLARFATFNCHGWNVRQSAWSAATRKALVKAILSADASIWALTECPEYMRDAIRAALPGGGARWHVATRGAGFHQAILFDTTKWVFGESVPVVFGPTSYHGGLWATFTAKATGVKLAVGAYHLPPNVVASSATQQRYVRAFLAAAPVVPARVAGGDGMDTAAWAKGWNDAREVAETSPNRSAGTYGAAIRDRIVSLGIVVRRYTVQPHTTGSDHRPVLAQITIPAAVPTN